MAFGLLAAGAGWANNLAVSNVTLRPRNDSTVHVQFDLRWENSWRYTNINHDAAWEFFKVKPASPFTADEKTLSNSRAGPKAW